MVDVSKMIGFILPDWIADILPGEYPVHTKDGKVEQNFKGGVLKLVTGDFELFKVPVPYGHIWDSFMRVFLGLVFGIIIGVPLGLFMGLNRFAKGFFDPLIELYRPVPPLAWAHARGGTGLYNSINGSKNPLANLFNPMNNPSGTPIIIPNTNPKNTLMKESQICP